MYRLRFECSYSEVLNNRLKCVFEPKNILSEDAYDIFYALLIGERSNNIQEFNIFFRSRFGFDSYSEDFEYNLKSLFDRNSKQEMYPLSVSPRIEVTINRLPALSYISYANIETSIDYIVTVESYDGRIEEEIVNSPEDMDSALSFNLKSCILQCIKDGTLGTRDLLVDVDENAA